MNDPNAAYPNPGKMQKEKRFNIPSGDPANSPDEKEKFAGSCSYNVSESAVKSIESV